MSSSSLPISSTRFASALSSLSISSLNAKAAELHNSIVHLQKSNAQLEEYLREDPDPELYAAIVDNREVIRRMEERILLVKREVAEVRGAVFVEPLAVGSTEVWERSGTSGNGRRTNGVIGEESNGAEGSRGGEQMSGPREAGEGETRVGEEEEEGVFL